MQEYVFLHEIGRDALSKCFAEGATLQRVFFGHPFGAVLELVWVCFGPVFWAPVDRCVKDSTLCIVLVQSRE